jgi:hypothetical protein
MGKLLSGRYGGTPEAISGTITLSECHQRLSLKPSDHVSVGEPDFFKKAYGAKGRYLLFQVDESEVRGTAAWKPGYYLLPLDALDVLKAMDKSNQPRAEAGPLPVAVKDQDGAPASILAQAQKWAADSQPLFFFSLRLQRA